MCWSIELLAESQVACLSSHGLLTYLLLFQFNSPLMNINMKGVYHDHLAHNINNYYEIFLQQPPSTLSLSFLHTTVIPLTGILLHCLHWEEADTHGPGGEVLE